MDHNKQKEYLIKYLSEKCFDGPGISQAMDWDQLELEELQTIVKLDMDTDHVLDMKMKNGTTMMPDNTRKGLNFFFSYTGKNKHCFIAKQFYRFIKSRGNTNPLTGKRLSPVQIQCVKSCYFQYLIAKDKEYAQLDNFEKYDLKVLYLEKLKEVCTNFGDPSSMESLSKLRLFELQTMFKVIDNDMSKSALIWYNDGNHNRGKCFLINTILHLAHHVKLFGRKYLPEEVHKDSLMKNDDYKIFETLTDGEMQIIEKAAASTSPTDDMPFVLTRRHIFKYQV
jgi:hypothetical protein